MKKNRSLFIAVIALLVLIGLIGRFIDHPPNFVPLAAIALVSAYYFSSKLSWVIPIGIMLISDLFIGFYDPMIMFSVYSSYLLIWGLGRWSRNSKSKSSLIPATLAGSVFFFLITNFAVWAFSPLYAKTLNGLYLSYAMGMPFYKWTLAGDLLYMAIFVGIIEGALFLAHKRSTVSNVLPNTNN